MAHQLPSTYLRSCSDGTITCLSKWAYNVTEGMFWVFALLGFCVAIYMATARLGSNRAFAFASFVSIVGSIGFATLNLISWWIASAFILVGLIGLAVMINSKN